MADHTFLATHSETGYIRLYDDVWADCWGASIGNPNEGITSGEAYCRISGSEYRLSRGRIRFDTSDCTGDIVSATLRITFSRIVENDIVTSENYLHIVRATGCGDLMAQADYAALRNNSTDICDPIKVSDIVVDSYIDCELNSIGKDTINTYGYTIIGLRLDGDINNIAPTDDLKEVWVSWYSGQTNGLLGYEAKLLVTDLGVSPNPTLDLDRVTGIRHMVGVRTYQNELTLGGFPTRWTPSTLGQAMPEEERAQPEVDIPILVDENPVTGEFRFYIILPNGRRLYIDDERYQ